jgi:hypothetical protein
MMTSNPIVPSLLLVAIIALFNTRSFAADATTQPTTREHLQLYLLIGQSNMAGRGSVDEQSKRADARVLTFTREQTWAEAVDPIHFDKKSAGVGPGIAFGKALAAKDPAITIGLIPCAIGGSKLSQWEKGAEFYTKSIMRCREAMKSGTLRGILWHQGESDAPDETLASTYGERLTKMIADLRGELGAGDVPIVVAPLGDFLTAPFAKKINDALLAIPKTVPAAACISSSGLAHAGDQLHFDTASARELGRRYAAAMEALTTKP